MGCEIPIITAIKVLHVRMRVKTEGWTETMCGVHAVSDYILLHDISQIISDYTNKSEFISIIVYKIFHGSK